MTDDKERIDAKAQLDEAVGELQTMADEIRLKMHLAGMDAKDAWNRLEPKLREYEQKVERAAELTGHELKDIGLDLKERFMKLKKDIG